ncbi:MAG TPA: hypothetical protein VNM92_08870 [Thermoanaerobaculia bacterium]|nr:hypothetical protein [Thermoanaerobaculia bacterium]
MPKTFRLLLVALVSSVFIILVSSQIFFFYRDNFSTHFPIKLISASLFRAGEIPYWNFFAGGGQPLAGNPNTLTFYPDNLLYLLFPALTAFNLHFLIHLTIAFFAMRSLAIAIGASRRAATIGATFYLISGITVSALAFYNLIITIAWIPAALLCAERLVLGVSWTRVLFLGSVLGLIGLSGEPVTVIATALSLVLVTARRLSLRTLAASAAAVVVALVIASPLVIAYSEIASETERAHQPFSVATVLSASVRPLQVLELYLGPFRGMVMDYSPSGYATRAGEWPRFLHTIFLGPLIVPALLFRNAPRRYQVMFASMLFISLGEHNPVIRLLVESSESLRVVRYPEKFAIPLCVAGVLLISRWIDEPTLDDRARSAILGAVVLILVGGFAVTTMQYPAPVLQRFVIGSLLALLCFALILRGPTGKLFGVLLSGGHLFFWACLGIPVDQSDPYKTAITPPPPGARVYRWLQGQPLNLPAPNATSRYRVTAGLLDPVFGATSGLRYIGDRSPEGMYSVLTRIVQERIETASLPLKLRYLRMLSCSHIITTEALPDSTGLRLERIDEIGGNRRHTYLIEGALPYVSPVRRASGVRSIQDAVRVIENPSFDEHEAAVTPARRPPTAPARIVSFRRTLDSVHVQVVADAPSTILVNESYFSGWEATARNRILPIVPLNIDRLGVIVPEGRSDVTLRFGRKRQAVGVAFSLSLLTLMASFGVALRASRNAMAAPAR